MPSSLGVSIPFIAGQWSLPTNKPLGCDGVRPVSIPFIAGQWSLLALWSRVDILCASLNPLHCGAVVASPS